MARLAGGLPENEFGLPLHIYRPDGIPDNFDQLPETHKHALLAQSIVNISYSEGFPTTPSGSLLWAQLDFESAGDFMLFQRYLEMTQMHGYRAIDTLAKSLASMRMPHLQQAAPSQNIATFSDAERAKMEEDYTNLFTQIRSHLRELFVYHYWNVRARAYDMVGQAAYRKIREQRAMILEDDHFIRTSTMVKKVFDRFDRFNQDELDEMDPATTVKVMKELLQMQRVSAGLPAAAPTLDHLPGDKATGSGQSMEVHLRTIAKTAAAANGNKAKNDTSRLLDSEEDTAIAQELIIRMMG
jgi:hypothetical protein